MFRRRRADRAKPKPKRAPATPTVVPVGLTLAEPELTQVTHSLNAMLEEMAAIDPPGFNLEEYVAVTLPADMEDAE